MEESGLITKAEKYLKEISNEEISLDCVEDFDTFKSLYFKLDDRLNKLQKMKDEMDSQGYTSPFRSLSKYGTNTVAEVSVDEMGEASRHNQYFRIKANAKKNILDRIKSAIDSHKIAIGNLEQYGYVKCESCYKTYRMSEYKQNDCKCKCGFEDFLFKINKDKSYRLEIIPHLPLSGNYMVLMSKFSNWGRDSFKNVLNNLKQERKGVVKTISIVIRYKDKNNRWIRKNVNLDSEYVANYEEEVRRIYGKDVRIELLRFHRTKPAIIDDKHARTALAIAYVRYSEELIFNIKDSIFKKRISNFKQLNKYDEINKKYNSMTPRYIEDQDTLEEWRNSGITKELISINYMDQYKKLKRSLRRDLKVRKNIEKTIFTNLAPTLILWDMFRYYISTSFNDRKKITGPFPYIRVELDRQQRKIFQTTYKKVIEVLNNETDMKIIPVKDMDLILYEKFKLEKLIKNSNIKLNYPALGAALINLNSDIEIETIGNVFNINDSKIKKEINNIKKLEKPKSAKSKQFLELIKK